MRRKPYKEGDWFAVPIESGYVLSRIARVGKRGGILLGYFFEPVRPSLPTPEDTLDLTPEAAFLVDKFGDRGLLEDDWPIIYRPDHWSRTDWPMPLFGSIDTFVPERGSCARYDEDDLSVCLGTWPITAEQALQLPEEGLSGHILLQGRLQKYFTEGNRPYNPQDRSHSHVWFHGLPDKDVT